MSFGVVCNYLFTAECIHTQGQYRNTTIGHVYKFMYLLIPLNYSIFNLSYYLYNISQPTKYGVPQLDLSEDV